MQLQEIQVQDEWQLHRTFLPASYAMKTGEQYI
jgi:hypothetical protein